ncbi:hypothetical protein [Metabacillus malikii]|uniref:Uncharacterized protein n=1 Tax=Metabacillus malikii TaxID=1504265 RepID=A0ABT9ZMX2_9BACI|nr:hypothetical protein [Metabacillus malikii]MDQ0233623.1 hypothetical protein [Metabacillus malikii]
MKHTEQHPYIFRGNSPNYEDHLEIISYPNALLISWSISPSTSELLSSLLEEDKDDLYKRIIINFTDNTESKIYPINRAKGVLSINYSNHIANCEFIICNSQNVDIVIARKLVRRTKQSSQQLLKDWQSIFSAYTVYE